ncbi:hypothetical protein [Xanthomonas phage DES1]|nr:hypothetical protein [Xanthomonas phage DES1]
MMLEGYVNFQGSEWGAIERWLLKQRETKIGLLIGAKTQEESDKLRGAISMIDQLMKLNNNRQTGA